MRGVSHWCLTNCFLNLNFGLFITNVQNAIGFCVMIMYYNFFRYCWIYFASMLLRFFASTFIFELLLYFSSYLLPYFNFLANKSRCFLLHIFFYITCFLNFLGETGTQCLVLTKQVLCYYIVRPSLK
jgi:hypothetical protein